MRSYTYDKRHRAYAVRDSHGGVVYRRTRTAAGMTATNARRGLHAVKPEVLDLCVKGTTSKLRGMAFRMRAAAQSKCRCCGQTVRKLELNDSGKLWLTVLRRRREKWLLTEARNAVS
jgi:hypothetical protein